jgi:hypothetical protein
MWRDFIVSSVGSCVSSILFLWVTWTVTGWAIDSVASLILGSNTGGTGLDGFF